MHFVALLQAAQDRDGVLNRRLADHHRLEPTLQRRVFLNVFPVFLQRRRADGMQFTARELGLEHVRRVRRAFRRTGADDGVKLVDEKDDLALRIGDFFQERFKPFLELAAEFSAGQH